MTDIKVAESAFVSAVAETLKVQNQILELRMRLEQLDRDASRANEAALRERGISEASSFDDILDAQDHFLTLALDRAGLADDTPIAKAARQQIKAARDEYAEMVRAEASSFGGMKGPLL